MNQLGLFEKCPICPHLIAEHDMENRGSCRQLYFGVFCGCYFGKKFDLSTLDRVRLGQGLAKRTDMATSVRAGRRKDASGTAETDAAVGLAVLKTGDFTDVEVSGVLGWPDPAKWRRRRVELCRLGLVRLSGEKRDGSAVWKITPH